MVRLDKVLSDAGLCSRSDARKWIRAGRVAVNGAVITKPETKVDPEADAVTADGAPVLWAKERYYMLHKPTGIITATEDTRQQTVLDLFPPELSKGLSPAGRLDKDTTGLLLLSTDGDWIHRIISPEKHVPKVYLAETEGTPTEENVRQLAEGIILSDGTKCRPARLEILGEGHCRVTVYEGKYHLVRRMLAASAAPVLKLHRVSIGGLILDDSLISGCYRALTASEIDAVFLNK